MQRSLRRVILCCWWIVFWLKKSMLNWTSLYKAQNNIYFRRIKLYTHPLKSHCNRTKYLENIEFLFFFKISRNIFLYSLPPKIDAQKTDAFSKSSRKFQNSKNFWSASSKSPIFYQNHFRSNSDTLSIPNVKPLSWTLIFNITERVFSLDGWR